MGGTMKVGQNRGRQYGLMLFVSFGAAIFGVMLLHKLREGRIFNLLVQEKDNQLVYLHRLLQKERDYNKEAKRKNEEMKAKIYSLRIQKGELDSRILEMESTISSLKDEQRTVESALEENQTDIKSLQEKKIEANKENPQVVALTETLKQKEAEIEDLKRLLKYPVKERDTAGEKSSDEVHGKKSTDSQDDGLGVREAKNNANATETIVNHGDDGKTRDEYEHEIAGTGETENLKSQAGGGGEEPKDRSKPQNSIDAENKSDGGGKIDINQHENFEKPNRTTESEDNEIAGDAGKQKSDELGQSEEHAGGVQRQTESTNDEKVDENSEEAKVGDKYEEPEDLEVAETQEAETDIRESRAGAAETQEAEADIRESRAEADEVKEESGEEADEPEF
ncbi:hypothetical protein Acr_17g0011830 [Actinidia rufa]|uniref:Micronuclear linker histone polyprotein-like protein n=1 Tax=Actinidia rufa TaxID=165716 RepID=A0A7J0G484_9ERIC|nr:hypothetical protein Acr_17g0011830 [Actinidia rufa]